MAWLLFCSCVCLVVIPIWKITLNLNVDFKSIYLLFSICLFMNCVTFAHLICFWYTRITKIPEKEYNIELETLGEIIATNNNCNIKLEAFLWSIKLAKKIISYYDLFFNFLMASSIHDSWVSLLIFSILTDIF